MVSEAILGSLNYESWTAVTTSLPFVISQGILWLLPLFLYISVCYKPRNGLDSHALTPFFLWVLLGVEGI